LLINGRAGNSSPHPIVHMTLRRLLTRASVAALSATLLAACGDVDAPTAPTLQPQSARLGRPSFDLSGFNVPLTVENDTTYATFTVAPDQAETFVFDRHSAIAFPAGGICDPSTSSYGPTEWDQPCEPAAGPVTVAVKKYVAPNGHVSVEFQPALRFNPASEGVVLYLEDVDDGTPLWFKDILYCTDAGLCHDESLTDPSLETYNDPATGLLGRRIKHFSGYVVSVGFGSFEFAF